MTAKASRKISGFLLLIFLAFFLLAARLFYLQILRGDSYLERSESNFIQERVIKHSRGKILDRDGLALADNRTAYDLYITFALLPDSRKNLRLLAQPINMPSKEVVDLDKKLRAMASANSNEKIILKSNLSIEQCKKVSEITRTKMIAGVEIERLDSSRCQVSLACLEFQSQAQTFNFLFELLGGKRSQLDELWQKAQKKSQGLARFKPSLLMADIGFDAYARIENAISLGTLAGVTVVPSQRRRY